MPIVPEKRKIPQSIFPSLLLPILLLCTIAFDCTPTRPALPTPLSSNQSTLDAQATQTLANLAQTYRTLNLPIPPKNAPLILFETGDTATMGSRTFQVHALAFLLQPSTKNRGPVVLAGAELVELHGGVITRNHATPDDIDYTLLPLNPAPFPTEEKNLLLAIQCEILGLHQQALKLYNRAKPSQLYLPYMAWNHQLNELLVPGSDRAAILERLTKILAAYPQADARDDPPETAEFLQNLKQTLAPPPPPTLPLEDQLNALTDFADSAGSPSPDHIYHPDHSFEQDLEEFDRSPVGVISKDSLRAIPALLAHLHDQRLTRMAFWHMTLRPLSIQRVQHFALLILQEIADYNLHLDDNELLQRIAAIQKEIEKDGEENYLKTHILLQPSPDSPGYLNDFLLRTLAAKYPDDLIPLYQQAVVEHRTDDARTLADLIPKNKLPILIPPNPFSP